MLAILGFLGHTMLLGPLTLVANIVCLLAGHRGYDRWKGVENFFMVIGLILDALAIWGVYALYQAMK